ncbi:MAG: FtsB family cell division protein [Gemmatimonadaceae bacterium]
MIVRLAQLALLVGALSFAVEGGEYGTSDLIRQRRTERRLRTEIDSLTRLTDSLRRYEKRLLTDPELQERIAREEFGMVRGDKELLYRFVAPAAPADSAKAAGRP